MDHDEKYNTIFKEWKKFMNGMSVDDSIISPIVQESWTRCKKIGIDPYIPKLPILDREKIAELLEKNKNIITISLPFMRNLHLFVEGSGFCVALFDANGYMLDVLGDHDVLEHLKGLNFIAGCCWAEDVMGTNAVGTGLKLDRPLQISDAESYCRGAHKWASSAAPLHNASSELIGLICITGPYQKANPHTLGMVVAVVYAIENEIKLRDTLNKLRIAHCFQKTVISSIPEIVVSIDNSGCISMVNENFKKVFGEDEKKLLGRNFAAVVGKNNKYISDLINNNGLLTDVSVRVSYGKVQGDFTLSCYPILSQDDTVGKVITMSEIKRARILATKMMGAKANFSFPDIIGQNKKFLEAIRQAQIASKIQSNVLLLGESGTGKDIFAQAIHNDSSRSDGPYVAINCATIPRDLITSDLFGYSEGAFTGSRKGGSQGKFELADGGTIFLDEIGETPLELQAALLRVIEDKSVIKIGGTRVTKIDVRIIAATNKDLKEEVRKGNFREDLYYRLNVFTIRITPLRERQDDILHLVDSFVKHIGKSLGKKIEKIEDDVLRILTNYGWPGNVRELQNVLERMINIAHTNILTVDLLPSEVTDDRHTDNPGTETVDAIERELIVNMIKSNIPKRQIAKKLGMSRSTLYRKLNSFQQTAP